MVGLQRSARASFRGKPQGLRLRAPTALQHHVEEPTDSDQQVRSPSPEAQRDAGPQTPSAAVLRLKLFKSF